MTSMPEFRHSDRLLVFAPHPDDETLATGGLIQRALASGAVVRVLIITDGDNNPWPQRWLERRWRIDAAARARWGQRRRAESRRALEILGVAPDALHCFGWPDLGLTGRLLADAASEQAIAAEIESFAPTHLAAPVLSDRHPDHNALGVLVEVALTIARHARPRLLRFIVHGPPLADGCESVTLTRQQQQTKQRALFAHATQVSLSETRLLAIAARVERFAIDAGRSAARLPHDSLRLRVPAVPRRWWSRRRDLLLVLGMGRTIGRARIALPSGRDSLHDTLGLPDRSETAVGVRCEGDAVEITLSGGTHLDWGFVKVERSGPRVVIYDEDGWHDLHDCLVGSDAATGAGRSIDLRWQ